MSKHNSDSLYYEAFFLRSFFSPIIRLRLMQGRAHSFLMTMTNQEKITLHTSRLPTHKQLKLNLISFFFLCCTWPTDCLNSKDNKPLTTECPRQMHSNREINQYKCKNSLRWGWNNYQNTESTYRKKFLSHARLQVTCKKTNFKEKVVQTSMKTWATIW